MIQATRTVDPSGSGTGGLLTQTPDVGPSAPTLAPTAVPPSGTIRLYLCPLAVLLLFAIGVAILSIVVPRIQERQQDLDDLGYSASLYGVASAKTDGNGPQQEHPAVPGGAAIATAAPAARSLDDSLLDDSISLEDISFAPNGLLLDDGQPLQDVSFDPLIEDLGPSGRQEAEHAPSASEEKNERFFPWQGDA